MYAGQITALIESLIANGCDSVGNTIISDGLRNDDITIIMTRVYGVK